MRGASRAHAVIRHDEAKKTRLDVRFSIDSSCDTPLKCLISFKNLTMTSSSSSFDDSEATGGGLVVGDKAVPFGLCLRWRPDFKRMG